MTVATELKQAYCRGCASPTFMFDPDEVYPPHRLYCDNCYGTGVVHYDCDCDEDEYPGECDCGHSVNYHNTTMHDCLMGVSGFRTLMLDRNGIEVTDIYAMYGDVLPRVDESQRPAPQPQSNSARDQWLADHTCQCGSTRFHVVADLTGIRDYEWVDIAEATEGHDFEHDDAPEVWASTDDFEDDFETGNYRFVCVRCGTAFQGDWDW